MSVGSQYETVSYHPSGGKVMSGSWNFGKFVDACIYIKSTSQYYCKVLLLYYSSFCCLFPLETGLSST